MPAGQESTLSCKQPCQTEGMAAWPLRNVFQVIQSSVVLEREPQECRALKQLKRRKENAQVAQVFSRPFFSVVQA